MSIKFTTNKSYLENVNGSKKFEEFNINYDSNRDKNKQVKASFNNNGKKYYVEDSLQKFMNNMPTSHNSIFDLLKNDLHESKNHKNTNTNANTNIINLSRPNKYNKLKHRNAHKNINVNAHNNVNVNAHNNVNVSRKNYRGNIRASKGITSKLFDYSTNPLPQHYNEAINVSSKHKLKHGKKYTQKIR